ncbi:MAG: glycosyltransferase family 2 protein [Anaerolineae bacterium]|jgi:glycosyltransferase involved in cell wall biosynthesis|nr:glycosyltransferase family 2 protein [Anaerolineae bacterium]
MPLRRPFFSILVPVYNEEAFIREALDSIFCQTDADWETLLIDDGSTDATPKILDEYAQRDPRFRVFHKTNGGTSTALNLGLLEARGEWVCWLSGDDLFHPQKLEFHRQCIEKYPEILFFTTGYWVILPNGKKAQFSYEWYKLDYPAYHLMQLLHSNWVSGISVCIKRETWLKVGEFDESLRYAQDLDMWVRLLLVVPHRNFSEPTCTMRIHQEQDSSRFPYESLFDASKILICLLNSHSFVELFPNVDLYNRQSALDILSRTIDVVAGNPDAYLYKLGDHPLLHLRILEWLWDPAMDTTLRDELRLFIIKRAAEIIMLYKESTFGLIWHAVSSALQSDQPNFMFFPCTPAIIGEICLYTQVDKNTEIARVLPDYLRTKEGVSISEAPTKSDIGGGQLVVLLPPDISLDDLTDPKLIKINETCKYLVRFGFFVLLVGVSKFTLGLLDGLPYLAAQTMPEQDRLLAKLGELDTVVALSHPERLKRISARRLVYFENFHENDLSNIKPEVLLRKIQAIPRRGVYHFFTAKRFQSLRSIYILLVPNSIRVRIHLGRYLRLMISYLVSKKEG